MGTEGTPPHLQDGVCREQGAGWRCGEGQGARGRCGERGAQSPPHSCPAVGCREGTNTRPGQDQTETSSQEGQLAMNQGTRSMVQGQVRVSGPDGRPKRCLEKITCENHCVVFPQTEPCPHS